ncbi:MAG: ABC transporter ATP-binding protein [Paracoccaceae bacterium]
MSPNHNGAEVVLRLDGITKRFGKLVANDAISLSLHRGEVLALLGENGAGKTTLMNILFGHYLADAGSVMAFGRLLPPGQPKTALAAGIGMVHQHFTLADHLTVLDNITLGTERLWSLGRGRSAALAKVQALSVDFGLVVDPMARVADLSVGERQRVEILKALYRDARVLILDEPTAVLTPQEAEALFQTLRLATARGLSVIFISHKLHEVMGHSDTCVVLRHGRVVGQVATRDTDRHALATMMVGAEMAEASIVPGVGGPVRLSLREVRAGSVRDVTLKLRGGMITGLAGVSGNGQAALADLIGGAVAPEAGEMLLDGHPVAQWTPRAAIAAGVGRIPEDRHKTGTVADFTLAENAVLETYATRFAKLGFVDWAKVRAHTDGLIAGYDVRCPGPEARIRLLSGGNMQKLILGRVLEEAPGIVIANQPVRGLDVGAIAYVHSRLVAARDSGAAVLLISEDLDEVMGLSDVIHVISEGRLSPAFARGALTQGELGLWMAGQGFGPGVGHAA